VTLISQRTGFFFVILEEFFTVKEVASILKTSPDSILRKFAGRPGVIDLGSNETVHKRRYRELRITRSALERFIREKSSVQ
jgi:hypothetical protein